MPVRRRWVVSAALLLAGAAPLRAQDSAWVRAHYVKAEYRVPMRDGKRLFTAVYAPRDTTRRYPILLTRTPYSVAPYGPEVTQKTKAAIAAKQKALVKGTFYEFTGPLYDQSGKLRVPKGKKLTVKDLYAIDWLVKGVVGSAKG